MDWLLPVMRTDIAGWKPTLISILVAFGLSQLIAATYIWTFRGLSYSRSLVQGLVLLAIVSCGLMMAIGNNMAAGIGVAGGLSIVRFRMSLRDPRDIVFVFAALSAGISCGLQAHAAAIIATFFFVATVVGMHATAFGSRREFDGLVRFSAPSGASTEEAIIRSLREHARNFVLVTLRSSAQGTMMEHAYQISLPDPTTRSALVRSLQNIDGIRDVSLLLQEPTLDL